MVSYNGIDELRIDLLNTIWRYHQPFHEWKKDRYHRNKMQHKQDQTEATSNILNIVEN